MLRRRPLGRSATGPSQHGAVGGSAGPSGGRPGRPAPSWQRCSRLLCSGRAPPPGQHAPMSRPGAGAQCASGGCHEGRASGPSPPRVVPGARPSDGRLVRHSFRRSRPGRQGCQQGFHLLAGPRPNHTEVARNCGGGGAVRGVDGTLGRLGLGSEESCKGSERSECPLGRRRGSSKDRVISEGQRQGQTHCGNLIQRPRRPAERGRTVLP
jgi:hypothetical protein